MDDSINASHLVKRTALSEGITTLDTAKEATVACGSISMLNGIEPPIRMPLFGARIFIFLYI